MKRIVLPLAILSVTLVTLPGRAQIIDDFSTSDSGNYNTVLAYGGGGPTPATFATSSGQLQPTGGAGNTTIFLRNTGQFLSDTTFGQSVSLDFVAIADPSTDDGSQLGADSIGFSTSLTPAGPAPGNYAAQDFEVGILRLSNGYAIASSNTSIGQASFSINANFSLGSITETITRLSDTGFSYKLSGPGLVGGDLTGNFTVPLATGQNIYFGPDVFQGNTTGDQILDNLQFNAAPEPGTWALMFGGLAFLVILQRSRKKSQLR